MKRRNAGFTLIELLMVVLVILMLSALLPRDVAAKERWAHYLRDLNMGPPEDPDEAQPARVNSDYGSDQGYSNSVLTILDPWRRDYRYDCPPPYLFYKLWSAGPDGGDNTPDDISNASF